MAPRQFDHQPTSIFCAALLNGMVSSPRRHRLEKTGEPLPRRSGTGTPCLLDTQSRNCRGQTPLPSKENETPGTGDLEGHLSPTRRAARTGATGARHDRLCRLESGLRPSQRRVTPRKNWAATDGVRCRPFGSEGLRILDAGRGKPAYPQHRAITGDAPAPNMF